MFLFATTHHPLPLTPRWAQGNLIIALFGSTPITIPATKNLNHKTKKSPLLPQFHWLPKVLASFFTTSRDSDYESVSEMAPSRKDG